MGISVPSNWVWWVKAASQGTGIGFQIVACQINDESGFNPDAVSPAGAEGIAQFLPSTFRSYATGSPFNPNDALKAYIGFMNALARIENNDIFNMLAAYNAGPGNIQAGFGYARTILNCAGAGVNVGKFNAGSPPTTSAGPSPAGSSDDWSSRVKNSGSQIFEAASNFMNNAIVLEKLW